MESNEFIFYNFIGEIFVRFVDTNELDLVGV